MLTRELIIATETLKGLSEEQISAITELSANDENTVIGTKFGEVYRKMDETIERNTGIKRNGDEKTYNFLERATKEFKEKFSDYDSLKQQITDLEGKVKEGGDEAIKAQLESSQKELAATKKQYTELKNSFETEKAKSEKALTDYKVESEINRAIDGIKFKAGYSDSVMRTLKAQAIANVKAKNPFFEERDGEQRLVFHNEDGTPINNKENKLNPYTAKELLIEEFTTMDILEKKPTKGAGGKEAPLTDKQHLGATTKVEAEEIIGKILAERGIAKTSLNYQAEYDKLYEENNIEELPTV